MAMYVVDAYRTIRMHARVYAYGPERGASYKTSARAAVS
jgi:hypothetical protein